MHPKHRPSGACGEWWRENQVSAERVCGILIKYLVSLARNYQRLVGFLSERGAFSCARKSISDFASLVRKSYSSQSSLDSTVVLVSERIATKSE